MKIQGWNLSDLWLAGWGGPGGYVYQKAYVELFCSSENLHALIGKVKENPSLTYIAVNAKGETQSNIGPLMSMLLPGVCSQGRKLFNRLWWTQ
jgi:hypothetical protein